MDNMFKNIMNVTTFKLINHIHGENNDGNRPLCILLRVYAAGE